MSNRVNHKGVRRLADNKGIPQELIDRINELSKKKKRRRPNI